MLKAKQWRIALAAVCTYSLACLSALASPAPCEAEILSASSRYGVPAGILYAVGLAETGRKGSLNAWALNIEGRAVFARSAQDALREFDKARKSGARPIDLGCMQINHHYPAAPFSSVREMLAPRRNVD